MILEYVLFTLFLTPLLIGWFTKLMDKRESNNKHKDLGANEGEKQHIKSALRMIISTIPYFGAYYYADLANMWLVLGIIYLLCGVLLLVVFSLILRYKTKEPTQYEKQNNKASKQFKNVEFWPKWKVRALCAFNATVYVAWVYSWRHLYA